MDDVTDFYQGLKPKTWMHQKEQYPGLNFYYFLQAGIVRVH